MSMTAQNQVQELYVAYFGRPADPSGLAYWVGVVEAGHPLSVIGAAFSASAEYMAQVPSLGADLIVNATNANQIVNNFYVNLFGHNADPVGLEYWANILLNNKATISQVAADIAGGAQGTDLTTLTAKIATADTFTTAVSLSTPDILAYSGASANAEAKAWLSAVNDQLPNGTADSTGAVLAAAQAAAAASEATTIATLSGAGTTYTLTAGVDTITAPAGNNNVINATQLTITPLDSINLGSTVGNVLNIVDTGVNALGTAPANANLGELTVSGVQTLNLLSATGLNGAAADVSGWTGLTAANITLDNVSTATSAVTAAATTAISLTETVTKAAGTATSVTGGSTVVVNETNTAAVTGVGSIQVNGAAGTTSVTVNQSGAGDLATITVQDKNYTAGTKVGTISTVSLSSYGSAAATINDSGLTTLTLAGSGAGVSVVNGGYATAETSLALNLNAATDAVGLTDATIKTLNITTGGTTGSSFALGTVTALKTVNVAGTEALTLGTIAASVTAVDVTGAAGLTATLDSGATFTSTSTGTDVVSITAQATTAIAGNGTAAEEIVWDGAATPAGGVLSSGAGSVSGFHVLGVGAAYANLSTANTPFNMTTLTGITGLDVLGGNATAKTEIQFTNVVAGTTLSVDSSVEAPAAAGNDIVWYEEAGTTGAADSVKVTVGQAANHTVVQIDNLNLTDSSGTTGIGSVTITSNDTVAGSQNVITTLDDANLSTLTVAGSAGLTVGSSIATAAAVTTFTINATETGTGAVALTELNGGATLATVAFTGVAATSIGTFVDTIATTLTVTDSDAGAVTIATGVAATLDAATLSFTNSSAAGTLAIGASADAVTDATAATIDLNGSVSFYLTGDTVTGGVTVAGATDNAKVGLSIAGSAVAAGGHTYTDAITLGNGADTVTVGAAAGVENITLGNGFDNVTVTDGTGTSTSTIVLGNGGNVTTGASVVNLLADTGTATVTVGTGMDTVKTGTGVDTVTFGAHASSATVFDTLAVGQSASSFAIPTTNSQTAVNAGALDVIHGLQAGDVLSFANITGLVGAPAGGGGASAVVSGSAANGLGGVNAEVTFAHGTYSGGNFNLSASGTDTLVTYDSGDTALGHHLVSIVLVGYDFNAATLPTTLTASAIVLH